MKKILMIAVMAVAAISANAQYTPQKGDFGTEVTFRPFGSANSNDGSTIKLKEAGIVGRYMLTDKDAVRAKLNFGWNSTSNETSDGKSYKEGSSTLFGIALGYERHFSVNDRLDLYAGAEASWKTYGTYKEDVATDGSIVELSNTDGGYNKIGVGVFTGINFYVYKKLFVGAELGLSFAHTSYKDSETKYADRTVTIENNKSNNSLGFYAEPALTLGWTF